MKTGSGKGALAIPLLETLARDHPKTFLSLLDKFCLSDGEYFDIVDELRGDYIDAGPITECGGCGCHHRRCFDGDCRNDLERI